MHKNAHIQGVGPIPLIIAFAVMGAALLFGPAGVGRAGILGPDGNFYPSEIRTVVDAARESPENPDLALAAARQLIREGRARGEAQLVEAAYGLLEPHLSDGASAVLFTQAAIARQYLHDFETALTLLDQALASDPRSLEALLTRANIHLVLGEPGEAARDCRSLAREGRYDLAVLCDTTAKALGAQAPAAYNRLASLLNSGRMDPNLRGYAFSVLGEIAMFQKWPDRARQNFKMARREDPDNLRTRMLQADASLRAGDAQAALDALENVPPTDAILVRQAIAYKALGREEALATASRELSRRFKRNIQLGSPAHAREEARYFLQVAGDPKQALARAQANWAMQREYEDAWLLIESAKAAGQAGAAQPVLDWMESRSVTAPALTERLRRPSAS